MLPINSKDDLDIGSLLNRFPQLESCKHEIISAYEMILSSFKNGGKLLVGGNGGSASDAEHIVAELMKSFKKKRPISIQELEEFKRLYGGLGIQLANNLEGSLPAISLNSSTSLVTAIANDIDFSMVLAQQVYGLGRSKDILLLISTSGNSNNIIQAARVGKVMGLSTVLLSGGSGGDASGIVDLTLKMPVSSTFEIQEMHVAVYHQICLWLEDIFFSDV